MKRIFLGLGILLTAGISCAQSISSADLSKLKSKEDSLKTLSWKIIEGRSLKERMEADSVFTKTLVRALLVKNSYEFNFDSLNVSRIKSPDGSFKIFTWQLPISENFVRQHGAIQMKTADGSLKLFPLIDKSDVMENVLDTVTSNLAWYGAVYYKMLVNNYQGSPIYTLIGTDMNDIRSTKKIIDVLRFVEGKPVFGAPVFYVNQDSSIQRKQGQARYIIEFKKGAIPKVSFDNSINTLVVEHLVSEGNQPKKKWTYVPDGDYTGFVWRNDQWEFVEKVFDVVSQNAAPTPSTIRNNEGNIDPEKMKNNGDPLGLESANAELNRTQPKKRKP